MSSTELKYEEAAMGPVTIPGLRHSLWWCARCHRIHPNSERDARACCSTDKPCSTDGCVARTGNHPHLCTPCLRERTFERWLKTKKVPVEFPLCLWDGDGYFWDESSLIEYMEYEELTSVRCEAMKVELPSTFEMESWCDELMPEDGEADNSNDDRINELILECAPKTYFGRGECFEYTLEVE